MTISYVFNPFTGKLDIINSASGTSATFVENELVAGANNTWTLIGTPVSGSLKLYGAGQRLTAGGVDYTLVGSVVTTVNPYSAGQILADYRTS